MCEFAACISHGRGSSSCERVLNVVGSIMVVGALTDCVLFHSMCDLKDTQMNVKYGLIWDFMLDKFELGHNATKKHLLCTKWRCSKQMVEEICSGHKNLNDQARTSRPKTEGSCLEIDYGIHLSKKKSLSLRGRGSLILVRCFTAEYLNFQLCFLFIPVHSFSLLLSN